jgi:Na+-translocating ferredoxin:NAD+ oxidoreductase RnfG subunit
MKLKQILLPTLALLVICLVVTAALSVTNHFTKDAIAKQAQQQITQTQAEYQARFTAIP